MIIDIDVGKLNKEDQSILADILNKAKAKKFNWLIELQAYNEAEYRLKEQVKNITENDILSCADKIEEYIFYNEDGITYEHIQDIVDEYIEENELD